MPPVPDWSVLDGDCFRLEDLHRDFEHDEDPCLLELRELDLELTEEQMLASPNPRDWYREWYSVWLPDGEDGLLDLGRDTTVAMVNERLDREFGPGAMFLGLQFGHEIVPATHRMTMEELADIGVDLAIGFGTENWYEGD